MTKVRFLFVIQRTAAYLLVLGALWWLHPLHSGWVWILGAVLSVWGSWDQWKRPDAPPTVVRRGALAEIAVILALVLLFHDAAPAFLFISPLARVSIHAGWPTAMGVGAVSTLTAVSAQLWIQAPVWIPIAQIVSFLAVIVYAGIMGELVRERDRFRRLVALNVAERERRTRDEERLRMAIQMHDTQGQAWTSVLRAIDVAMRLSGDQQQRFLQRARDAAQSGLQEMRAATHDWYQGRRTPTGWIEHATNNLRRLETLTEVKVHLVLEDVEWKRFSDAAEIAELLARAMLEGAGNAVRHGKATEIWEQLASDGEGVHLRLRDNGHGRVPIDFASTGVGLSSLTQAAQANDGSLAFEGIPGRGSALSLYIPFSSYPVLSRGDDV